MPLSPGITCCCRRTEGSYPDPYPGSVPRIRTPVLGGPGAAYLLRTSGVSANPAFECSHEERAKAVCCA